MTLDTAHLLPGGFRRIRMELAREPDHPEGSGDVGYEFLAPLTPDGHLDASAWAAHRTACRAVRFQTNEEHRAGHLVRRAGGSWAFRYEDLADEPGYRFDSEPFQPGEYVSVRRLDGEHAFKLVSVLPIT